MLSKRVDKWLKDMREGIVRQKLSMEAAHSVVIYYHISTLLTAEYAPLFGTVLLAAHLEP